MGEPRSCARIFPPLICLGEKYRSPLYLAQGEVAEAQADIVQCRLTIDAEGLPSGTLLIVKSALLRPPSSWTALVKSADRAVNGPYFELLFDLREIEITARMEFQAGRRPQARDRSCRRHRPTANHRTAARKS